METNINCAEACINGCVLGDSCPKREYAEQAAKFISNTALDTMHDIAEAALRKKMAEPPKWVIPDFLDSNP
ncbi:MAG: hypothetical protein J7641_23700 [Cyanobacteria bacterium SID2]|nr:hypothetical protein [Cyanobacteria bacterium SID2]MBP0005914.1 hypothetical protein [Cyanobacteria bacterium SBC]